MTIPHSADSPALGAAVGAAVAFLVTIVLVPVTIRLARRLGVVDEPGARSSHTIDTPRLGGIAVGAGALAGLAVASAFDSSRIASAESGSRLALVLGAVALLVGSIGLADDLLRGIPVWVRLVAQLVVVAAVIAPWAMHNLADDPSASRVIVLAVGAAATAWVIGYVNVFNFMDGVDGMSGFVAIVVGLDLAVVGGLDDRAPSSSPGSWWPARPPASCRSTCDRAPCSSATVAPTSWAPGSRARWSSPSGSTRPPKPSWR